MKATFLDQQGKDTLAVMGCYGIGVSRTAAATIEQHHDAKGIIWPIPIAPFHIHLLPVTVSDLVGHTAQALYDSLSGSGIEVLWDDRNERAGVKFNDADLIGAPFQLTIGDKGLAKGFVEVKRRSTGEVAQIEPEHIASYFQEHLGSYL